MMSRLTLWCTGMMVLLASVGRPAPVFASLADQRLTSLQGSATVFAGVTHSRINTSSGYESTTEPEAGVRGSISGQGTSGPSRFSLGYNATVNTRRDLPTGEQSDNSQVNGRSTFSYLDPANPLSLNVFHQFQSVRNNTGFVINPSSYDTRQVVGGGANLRTDLGSLTSAALGVQHAETFDGGDLSDSDSTTVSANLDRRLSERVSGFISTSRTWADEGVTGDSTTDSVSLGFRRTTETGFLNVGIGRSRVETDDAFTGNYETEATTGYLEKGWQRESGITTLRFERALYNTASDLTLDLPEGFSRAAESIRIQETVLSDSVLFTSSSTEICSFCRLTAGLDGSVLESQSSGETTHELGASLAFSADISALQSFSFSYRWQADTDQSLSLLQEQLHRFTLKASRALSEDSSLAVEFNQAFIDSRIDSPNQQDFSVNLLFTHGFSLLDSE